MTRLPVRSFSRLSTSTNAPPPVLTTWLRSAMMRPIASRSNTRKAASPSSRKICGIVRPVISSMKRSESTNCIRSRLATLRPSVVLPLQLNPTRTRLSMRVDKCPVVGERLVQAVAAELQAQRVGEHQRDHRLAHHAGGGDDAYIAALHVRNVALPRRVVDRWQRVDER